MICMAFSMSANAAAPDVKGTVTDENGEALPFANVVLVSLPDSQFVAGTISGMDGTFEIKTGAHAGAVKVSMVGYDTWTVGLGGNMDIQLKPAQNVLGEVEIRATLPKTTLTPQGIETKIEGTVLADAGTAKDALARVPGMIKNRDGLEVIGKGSPLIYINGRKMRDSGELDRLKSNEILSVEVLNNPGAKYDASVGSVVIIRTVKRQGEGIGLNLSLSDDQSLDYADHSNLDGTLALNWRRGQVDVFGGGNIWTNQDLQDSKIFQQSRGDRFFKQEGIVTNGIDYAGYSANGGLNWQVNDAHSLGLRVEYRGGIRADQDEMLSESLRSINTVAGTNVLEDSVTANGAYGMDGKSYASNGNIYYNGRIGSLGIDFNADYYVTSEGQQSNTKESDRSSRITQIDTRSLDKNRLLASKLVLSHPVWQGMLEVGSELTSSYHYSDYFIDGASASSNTTQSDVFEDNVAAFAQYGFALMQKYSVSAGLRYEHVGFKFKNVIDHSGDMERKYDNLFPSIAFSGAVGPVYTALSYSNRTLRPNFSQLSDAVRYNSRFTLQQGNSQLKSQTVQSLNLTLNYKVFTIVGEYSRTDDPILQWSRPLDMSSPYYTEGAVIVSPANIDEPWRQLVVYVNAAPTIAGKWVMSWTAGVQQQWLEYDIDDEYHLSFSDRPFCFVQLNNTLLLPASWQGELGFEWHSRGYQQNILIDNVYYDLNCAIQKKLLKDGSLVLRLKGKDLLARANSNIVMDCGYQIVKQSNRMDSRRVELTARYSFNAARSKYKGTGAGQDVINRMK